MARRLQPTDRLTLGIFLCVWVFAMVMRAWSLTRPAAHILAVHTPAGEYPVVREVLPISPAPVVLKPGDRVVQVAGRDVRGLGGLQLGIVVTGAAWDSDGAVPAAIERDGQRVAVDLAISGNTMEYRTNLIIALIWGIVAVLILVRAPGTPSTRATFQAAAASAVLYTASFHGPGPIFTLSVIISFLALVLTQPLLIRAYLCFPDDGTQLEGVNRFWPWLFSLVGVVIFAAASGLGIAPDVARPLSTALVFVFVITLAVVLTRSYRRNGPVGRRKIKWVLYPVYVGSLISLTSFAIGGVVPRNPEVWQSVVLLLSSVTFPVSVLIAVLRYDLYDIDRLIGATVAYNLLGFVVAGVVLLVVPSLAQAMSAGLSLDPTVGRSGITLALAAAAVLVQRRVRPYVDRVFFKERFALERALKELPERLAVVRRTDELWNQTGTDLVQYVNPASCVIFTVGEGVFVPVYTHGDAVPSSLSATSELVRWVTRLGEATIIDRRTTREMGDSAAAMLAALEVMAVVPVHRKGILEAFICLGEKRSGDIYTGTDLALLTTLARSLSLHLLRFDEAELLERSRAMQEKMRRYVPGAIAEHIEEGRDLETGEREVSVLFVDIRGYTAYADGRAAEAIFSTVNRYTEAVSSIVRDEGGVVVEFNGDGMMAIFGAPRPLADKEAAAVRCARRLVVDVARVGLGDADAPPLSVGVGVATGPAFVGNIQAVDRTIWSAIGSTTNLAARLQSLTREMEASIVVDAATSARARQETAGFRVQADTTIRGRKEAVTLHALPLAGAVAASATA